MPDSLNKYVPDNPEYHIRVDRSSNAPSLPFESRDILSEVVSDRILFLYDSIRETNLQLLQRTELRNDFQQEICKEHVRIQNLLYELENKGKDISSLELRLADLSQEERQQQLSHWRDTVELKRERRNTEKELRSAILDFWLIRFLSQETSNVNL